MLVSSTSMKAAMATTTAISHGLKDGVHVAGGGAGGTSRGAGFGCGMAAAAAGASAIGSGRETRRLRCSNSSNILHDMCGFPLDALVWGRTQLFSDVRMKVV